MNAAVQPAYYYILGFNDSWYQIGYGCDLAGGLMALLNFPEETRTAMWKNILRTALRVFMEGKDVHKERGFISLSLPCTPMQLLCPAVSDLLSLPSWLLCWCSERDISSYKGLAATCLYLQASVWGWRCQQHVCSLQPSWGPAPTTTAAEGAGPWHGTCRNDAHCAKHDVFKPGWVPARLGTELCWSYHCASSLVFPLKPSRVAS